MLKKSLYLISALLLFTSCNSPNASSNAAADTPTENESEALSSEETTEATAEATENKIFINGSIYTSTGRPAYVTCGTADGEIKSVIESNEIPKENFQANFGSVGDAYCLLDKGAIGVSINNDKYTLFLDDNTVEFKNRYYNKADLSEETLKWLDNYNNLSDEEKESISNIPQDLFYSQTGYASYLTDEELKESKNAAEKYLRQIASLDYSIYSLEAAPDDYSLYKNRGIEAEYTPGNIIIYLIDIANDTSENPKKSISVARENNDSEWKVINYGY